MTAPGAPEVPLRIEYVSLSNLLRWPRNPKEHDLGAIHQSFKRFGYVAPIIVDETTGRIVVGHGRLDALVQWHKSGDPAPARVLEQEGAWLVPVIRGIAFPSEMDAGAYLLADNRTQELGDWNDAELVVALQTLLDQSTLDGTGFDEDDLDALLARVEGAPPVDLPTLPGIVVVFANPQLRDALSHELRERGFTVTPKEIVTGED